MAGPHDSSEFIDTDFTAHKAPFAAPTREDTDRRVVEAQQKLVELAFFEGMSHTEIAEKTGDALGTVKTRIRTALMSLRKGVQG